MPCGWMLVVHTDSIENLGVIAFLSSHAANKGTVAFDSE